MLFAFTLSAATMLFLGFVDNPIQPKALWAAGYPIATYRSDAAIHVTDDLMTVGEGWSAELKPVNCSVENGTTLVKTTPKAVLTSSVSRGGDRRTKHVAMNVPVVNTSFKAYMDYRMITNRSTKQWKLQQQASTNREGFRMIGDDYLVALGTYYAEGCGERFHITLSSGKSFTVMVGDIKSNRHTNETRQYCPRDDGGGGMIEFIIDSKQMSPEALRRGDLSCLGLQGTVTGIERIVQ